MKLEKKELNNDDIQSTGTVTAMKLSEHASAMVFSAFTDSIYSDPIGTIIREITSNCFDAHVEAGTDSVKNPVVVKLTEEVSGSFISFIDKGVGMSPNRIHNIYGAYFESTKNHTNDMIGGFGVGGKTPLAYTNSFFVVTRHEGIQYTYNVFAGNESPMIELLSQESTKAVNGTEVKIPIKSNDRTEFERKTLRQLFYFENIIFEGFSDHYATNDYVLFKGKDFIFRSKSYSPNMHVCLGKVAYPIDFDALGVSSYDYQFPVAIQLEIGELSGTGVNISREALKYNAVNNKIIINKMNAVKVELMNMLANQYDNVQSMSDYYKVIGNLGSLNIGEETIEIPNISKSDVVFPNFKYDAISMPKIEDLVKTFYSTRMFGKKEARYYGKYNNTFAEMQDMNNVVYVNDGFKRVVLKQSYLQYLSSRFFIHTPIVFTESGIDSLKRSFGLTTVKEIPLTKKEIKAKEAYQKAKEDAGEHYIDTDGMFKHKTVNVISKSKADALLADLKAEVHGLMTMYAINYDTLVVPEDYIALRKANRISPNVLKTGIPVKDMCHYGSRDKLIMEDFVNHNGRVYYGFQEDKYNLESASSIFENISGRDNTFKINRYRRDAKGTMFIQISKSNEKYLKMLGKKAIHIKYFYETYVARKIDLILENKANEKAETMFDNKVLVEFGNPVFKDIDSEIYEKASKIRNSLKGHSNFYANTSQIMYKLNIDIDAVKFEFEHKEELEYLTKLSDGCRDRFQWIRFPYSIDPENNKGDRELVDMVNLFIDK